MEKIDGLLEEYAPGAPDMKPDVIQQKKKLKKREKIIQEQQQQQQNQQPQYKITQNGKEEILTLQRAVEILGILQNAISEKDKKIQQLQEELNKKNETVE